MEHASRRGAGRGALVPVRQAAAAAIAVAALAVGCLPGIGPRGFEPGDLRPAAVAGWGASGPDTLVLRFDEPVTAVPADFALSCPSGCPASVVEILPGTEDGELSVRLDGSPGPGAQFAVSGSVLDFAGNMTAFVLPFWGWNPEPAGLIINEVISEGSSTHPDLVEFRAMTAGDLAGLSFFVGTPADHELRHVFPSCRVEAGELVVLHLKPQGLPAELDETGALDASGGVDATATGRDFWYRGEKGGIPGKNGALSLAIAPMGSVADAFLYSERYSDSDADYAGFGTAAFRDRVCWLVDGGNWLAEGEEARPEDCFRSAGTTATRSMCRSSSGADTDSAGDWHIVPSRGATPGEPNSDETYEP